MENMKAVTSSIRSKGLRKYLQRGKIIARSYGVTPETMARQLERFSHILERFRCGATFPVTAVALQRNPDVIRRYAGRGIEFAIHGYRHIDHSLLTLEDQTIQLQHAKGAFQSAGIPVSGFRSPYLRFNAQTRRAVQRIGLDYVSNQPVLWEMLDHEPLPAPARAAYALAVAFYNPRLASSHPSLPEIQDGTVEIPVSLPDDEILVDRLGNSANGFLERTWSHILADTHAKGELFTLQLHPERTTKCASALSSVLLQARALNPPVWIARLEEVAAWWKARADAIVAINATEPGQLRFSVEAPTGTSLLVRGVGVEAPTKPWSKSYRISNAQTLLIHSDVRPVVGLPMNASANLAGFLRQQGYIVERSSNRAIYSLYVDQEEVALEDRRCLLDRLAADSQPLVKLGRWPNGAQSALCITGDIDALTIWDFGLRLFGR